MARRRPLRVEGDAQVVRLLLAHDLQEHRREAVDRVRREALRVRQVPDRVERPVDVGVPVDEVEPLARVGHSRDYTRYRRRGGLTPCGRTTLRDREERGNEDRREAGVARRDPLRPWRSPWRWRRPACSGRYGSLRFDNGVARTFEAAQVLPGHRYYTTGSETDPAAIVALREDRPLRGAWREIAATPALLKKLADNMRGTRLAGPDGAVIVDDRGERIGVWYSYRQYPPPPRLLDDGGVELNPAPVSLGRRGPRAAGRRGTERSAGAPPPERRTVVLSAPGPIAQQPQPEGARHVRDRRRPGPRDPRFPRQPDRRGRGRPRERRLGALRRPVRRLHRRPRGARAARRRQEALPRQGRAQGGRQRQRRARPRDRRPRGARPGVRRPHADPRSTAPRPRSASARTRSSASRWRSPRPPRRRPACRSTSTSAASTRARCRCR